MKKFIFLFCLLVILTGCSNKEEIINGEKYLESKYGYDFKYVRASGGNVSYANVTEFYYYTEEGPFNGDFILDCYDTEEDEPVECYDRYIEEKYKEEVTALAEDSLDELGFDGIKSVVYSNYFIVGHDFDADISFNDFLNQMSVHLLSIYILVPEKSYYDLMSEDYLDVFIKNGLKGSFKLTVISDDIYEFSDYFEEDVAVVSIFSDDYYEYSNGNAEAKLIEEFEFSSNGYTIITD